jgi:hypothetical protein
MKGEAYYFSMKVPVFAAVKAGFIKGGCSFGRVS